MPRRKKKKAVPMDARMERILAIDPDELLNDEYVAKLGTEIPTDILSKAVPDQQTVYRVLEFIFSDVGAEAMDPDLARIFDRLLSGYKTKNRLMLYALGREHTERIVDQVDLEKELLQDLRDALPYMSNENKAKILTALGSSISAGMESQERRAGINDVPEDVQATLQGHITDSTLNRPFKEATGEEREAIRKFVETVKDMVKPASAFTTLAPEEPDVIPTNSE